MGTRSIFETYNTASPTLSFSCEDYGLVFRLTERGSSPKIRMNLDAQLLGEQPMYNTIATMRGSEKPNEYVMLSAHFDSWDGALGRDGQRHRHDHDARGDAHPAAGVSATRSARSSSGTGRARRRVSSARRRSARIIPRSCKGLQALFNQDNGTGRDRAHGCVGGLVDGDVHLRSYLAKLPTEFQTQIQYGGAGRAVGRRQRQRVVRVRRSARRSHWARSDWNYGNETWHTERDTYDKIVFDDLKSNATLAAMLVYLASEDPTFDRARAGGHREGGGGAAGAVRGGESGYCAGEWRWRRGRRRGQRAAWRRGRRIRDCRDGCVRELSR